MKEENTMIKKGIHLEQSAKPYMFVSHDPNIEHETILHVKQIGQ